ncbi:MAG: bifunctional folylpolyglutamate synthase/dihydrofolate synthase [Ruminococcus sp.]|nr:bifunctional folylpolyglutamate synthase/dihydrofolate synthase [Ruminococcus sp.]
MNFKECMEFIGSYSRLGGKVTDLSRARELMERIGNPEKKLKFVHIAGTNGKGSTLEYIADALMYSGYKTGRFTSPFVTHYTDRIRINDREIDEKSLGEICGFVAENVADKKYSQFEITMAIAMLWYVREECDIVVLETGIGGLLDSTNVIPPPLLSVITSISHDHTDILGNTIEEITAQKAGIIKENSAVVLSRDNSQSVRKIISEAAYSKNSEFIVPEHSDIQSFPMEDDGCPFVYKGKHYKTAMLGFHQISNAVTAIEVCRYLRKKGYGISEESIKRAIETAKVEARVQYIDKKPPIIVDGGHNPSGVNALYNVIINYKLRQKKIYTILGMVDTKDYIEAVKTVSDFSDEIFCVDGFAPNCVPAERLAEIARKRTEAEPCTLSEAVEKATALALENDGIVVICGSLYLASEYLNSFEK